MKKVILLQDVLKILDGIDKTEADSDEGWWETSTGAEFGSETIGRLKAVAFEVKENSGAREKKGWCPDDVDN